MLHTLWLFWICQNNVTVPSGPKTGTSHPQLLKHGRYSPSRYIQLLMQTGKNHCLSSCTGGNVYSEVQTRNVQSIVVQAVQAVFM